MKISLSNQALKEIKEQIKKEYDKYEKPADDVRRAIKDYIQGSKNYQSEKNDKVMLDSIMSILDTYVSYKGKVYRDSVRLSHDEDDS